MVRRDDVRIGRVHGVEKEEVRYVVEEKSVSEGRE